MSHSWSAEVRTTGLIEASDESVAQTVRDARLALDVAASTPEDAAVWAGLVSTVNSILTAIDPSHTGTADVHLFGSGLHAGFDAAACGLSIGFSQPGAEMTEAHHVTFDTARPLAAAETTLARSYMEAVLQARGHTFTADDAAVFNALSSAAQTLTQLLEPGVSGSVRVDGSALVNPGLDALQVSLQVSSTQPQPADSPAASLPAGSIIAFRGLAVPSGWLLCDGTNGTPDLRGRFIIGDTAPGSGSAVGVTDPTVALSHAVTQPSAHTVTQPNPHSNHVVTQPSGHATAGTGTSGSGLRFSNAAAATHSGTAVDAHSAHAGTGVSVHTGSAVSDHPALAHYRLVYIIKE